MVFLLLCFITYITYHAYIRIYIICTVYLLHLKKFLKTEGCLQYPNSIGFSHHDNQVPPPADKLSHTLATCVHSALHGSLGAGYTGPLAGCFLEVGRSPCRPTGAPSQMSRLLVGSLQGLSFPFSLGWDSMSACLLLCTPTPASSFALQHSVVISLPPTHGQLGSASLSAATPARRGAWL